MSASVIDAYAGFGVVADGSDQATRLQAFFDALRDAGPGVQGILTPGEIVTSSPILFDSHVSVKSGWMTSLKLADNTNGGAAVLKSRSFDALTGTTSTLGETRFSIENLRIDGNRAHNASGGPGLAVFGYCFNLANLDVRNTIGRGIHSEWGSSSALGAETSMESYFSSIRGVDCDGGALWIDGPHDSIIDKALTCLSSSAMASSNPHIYLGSKSGGYQISNSHAWGAASYGYDLRASGSVSNSQAESSRVACVRLGAGVVWTGGRVFSNPSWTTDGKVGFEFHSPGVTISDVYMEHLNNGFFDFTSSNGANSKISANIWSNGAGLGSMKVVTGVPTGSVQWDVLASLTAPCVLNLPASAKRTLVRPVNDAGSGRSVQSSAGNATLSSNDVGGVRELTYTGTGAVATIPADNGTIFAGDEIEVVAVGNAATLAGAAGVVIQSRDNLLGIPKYGRVLLRKRAANTWIAVGDLQ